MLNFLSLATLNALILQQNTAMIILCLYLAAIIELNDREMQFLQFQLNRLEPLNKLTLTYVTYTSQRLSRLMDLSFSVY